MKNTILFFLMLVILTPIFALAQAGGGKAGAAKAAARPNIFDPTRDAAKDLQAAIADAAISGRRVLVDVGGNWCSWCHEMERFIDAHPDLRALRDKNFVTVKINWSPENKNEAVLSKYPKISGYPHLFILDNDGKLLHSEDTSKLEDGKSSYVLEKFMAFMQEWAPPGKLEG